MRKNTHVVKYRRFILVEIIARVIKNNLRWILRQRHQEIKLPLEEPYLRIVIDYLNHVFGNTMQSEDYWLNCLKNDIINNFEDALTDDEMLVNCNLKNKLDYNQDSNFDRKHEPNLNRTNSNFVPKLRENKNISYYKKKNETNSEPSKITKLDVNFLNMIFNRVKSMMGLQYSHDRNYSWDMEEPFNDTDLKSVGFRVKHMNIISQVQGFFWQINGLMARSSMTTGLAIEYYKSAIDKYEEALDLSPENKDVLRNLALTWLLLIEEDYKPGQTFPASDIRVKKVQEYCMRAISAHPKYDSLSLFRYANLLSRCNRNEEAEDYYLQSLEADPNNTGCLHQYAEFLSDQGLEQDAENFYRRSSQTTAGAHHIAENYY